MKKKLLVLALVGLVVMSGVGGAQTTTEETEQDDLFDLWDNALAFIGLATIGAAGIGLASGSMAISAWGGYLMFVHLTLESGAYTNLTNVVYATLTLIMIGIGFKLWRLEGGGEA